MKKIFFLIIAFLSEQVFAESIKTGVNTTNSLIKNTSSDLVSILSYVERILLRGVLPVVAVGVFLHVAGLLLMAEGNEEEMKKAWKTLTYSAIAFIAIALAYAAVAIVSRLSF